MPIYEYRCSACGFEKDALQKMSAAPLVDCPQCGTPSLVKLVSAAGFQLKGSGWYATDFKGSGSAKPAAKSGDAAPADTAAQSGGDAAPVKSGEASASKSESPAAKPATPSGAGD